MGDSFDRESRLRQKAYDDLPALVLTDRSCSLLRQATADVAGSSMKHYTDDIGAQRTAVVYLGVDGLRAVRCLVSLVVVGYQAEALVFLRKLIEIDALLKRALDPTAGGAFSKKWLAGSARSGLPKGLPEGTHRVHHVAHADSRGITQHRYRDPFPDAVPSFTDRPRRDSRDATRLVTWTAHLSAELAFSITQHSGAELEALTEHRTEVDRQIAAAPEDYPYIPRPDGYVEDLPVALRPPTAGTDRSQ